MLEAKEQHIARLLEQLQEGAAREEVLHIVESITFRSPSNVGALCTIGSL